MPQMRLFQNHLPQMPQACPSEGEWDEIADEVGGPGQHEERREAEAWREPEGEELVLITVTSRS